VGTVTCQMALFSMTLCESDLEGYFIHCKTFTCKCVCRSLLLCFFCAAL